jgi:hypothetical protein
VSLPEARRQLRGPVRRAERGWAAETPLWYYILKEADVLHNGDQLGPVGGRIVGEVLIGIIDADPDSFRSVDPTWTPTLPARRAGAGVFGWQTSWSQSIDGKSREGSWRFIELLSRCSSRLLVSR